MTTARASFGDGDVFGHNAPGQVVNLSDDGTTTASVTLPSPVRKRLEAQDLQYAATSGRG
ncbi:hypothetical protein [Streptomyces sp. NPDC086989]|uniref:hypothetical protein n=1 Tax=Streptomyces sp. NPDC086989 TaxID=3365764 RepID=UPI0038201D7E